jgi:hypothetical protein
MWSSKFTGTRGVVKDSYQRVGVRVTAEEFEANYPLMLEFVVEHSLRHIVFEFDVVGSKIDLHSLHSKITKLTEKTLSEKHLHWTFEIINYQINNPALSFIVSEVKPDVIIIRNLISRSNTLEAITDLSSLISQSNSHSAIGLSGLDLPDVQYCLDSNPSIALVDVGVCLPPNIHAHIVEFCHSRGRNSLVDLRSLDDFPSEAIRRCSEKYNRTPAVILAKAILQIGAILCLPCSLLADERFLPILELNHPFIQLQTAYDPSNLSRLVLSNEEMEAISADSLMAETEKETSMLKKYIARPGVRQLRNISTVGLVPQRPKQNEDRLELEPHQELE